MNHHFLGIDLGSLYTKFVVINGDGREYYREVIPTLSRDRQTLQDILRRVYSKFTIKQTCATGYGRNSFDESDLRKTELICASVGVSKDYDGYKTIMDIGGEDIKIIESGPQGEILHFYMNDKCSAGTGAFITEIAEKAELELEEMSKLAKISKSQRELNSFCTVFAKSEILGWKFDGVPVEDIARGIYLSIVSRIQKLRFSQDYPIILCGGVIKYHPYLRDVMKEKFGLDIQIASHPQYRVALGAALLARKEGIRA